MYNNILSGKVTYIIFLEADTLFYVDELLVIPLGGLLFW